MAKAKSKKHVKRHKGSAPRRQVVRPASPPKIEPEPEVTRPLRVEWPNGINPYEQPPKWIVPSVEPQLTGIQRAQRSIMRAGMMLAELRWRRGE